MPSMAEQVSVLSSRIYPHADGVVAGGAFGEGGADAISLDIAGAVRGAHEQAIVGGLVRTPFVAPEDPGEVRGGVVETGVLPAEAAVRAHLHAGDAAVTGEGDATQGDDGIGREGEGRAGI